MKSICVFCGSSPRVHEDYLKMARNCGREFALRGHGLIYGGASRGVMGALADGHLEGEGHVHGVIPQSIKDFEIPHEGLSQLDIVQTMHERKMRMYELSSAFFALPGGMGTLDELCETLTWAQLGYHHKPCYIINYKGFFDDFLNHIKRMNREGFFGNDHLKLIKVFGGYREALDNFDKR